MRSQKKKKEILLKNNNTHFIRIVTLKKKTLYHSLCFKNRHFQTRSDKNKESGKPNIKITIIIATGKERGQTQFDEWNWTMQKESKLGRAAESKPGGGNDETEIYEPRSHEKAGQPTKLREQSTPKEMLSRLVPGAWSPTIYFYFYFFL